MNHPNLPVFKWVYHTRPSFFKEKVCYDAKREFHYLRLIEKKNKTKLEEKMKKDEHHQNDPLDPLYTVDFKLPTWRERADANPKLT